MPIGLSISRPLLAAPAAAEELLLAGLSNAAAATLLAVLVALVCRVGAVRRRPAVVHGLWLLVLLKLLVPPMWSVELAHPPSVSSVAVPPEAAPAAPQPAEVAAADETDAAPAEPEVLADAEPEAVAAAAPAAPVFAAAPAPERVRRWSDRFRAAAPAAAALWAAGTMACLLLAAVRIARFRRVLRHAPPAPPEAQARAADLSAEMGLAPSSCPGVWFVPGAVSPMLWALPRWLGGPRGSRLLLPAALWEQLDDRQRDAILLHELAHLRRRDHWVRLVELAVTALWWWHPVAWWARRRLREAEEQCCDAWVVWARPASVRHYATALLEALDFAAASIFPGNQNGDRRQTPALPAVPALASGMAEFHELKRRLVMIKQGPSTARVRKLSWAGLSGMFGVAALLLPVVPTVGLAQEAQETLDSAPAADTSAGSKPAAEPGFGSAREAGDTVGADAYAADSRGTDPSAAAPRGADVRAADAQGAEAHDPYAAGHDKTPVSGDARVAWKTTATRLDSEKAATFAKQTAAHNAQLAEAQAQVERLRAQLRQAEYQVAVLKTHANVPALKASEDFLRQPAKTAQPRATGGTTVTVPAKLSAKLAAPDEDREARLRRLEDNLGVLLQEVKALRHEKSGDASGGSEKRQSSARPEEPASDLKRVR